MRLSRALLVALLVLPTVAGSTQPASPSGQHVALAMLDQDAPAGAIVAQAPGSTMGCTSVREENRRLRELAEAQRRLIASLERRLAECQARCRG